MSTLEITGEQPQAKMSQTTTVLNCLISFSLKKKKKPLSFVVWYWLISRSLNGCFDSFAQFTIASLFQKFCVYLIFWPCYVTEYQVFTTQESMCIRDNKYKNDVYFAKAYISWRLGASLTFVTPVTKLWIMLDTWWGSYYFQNISLIKLTPFPLLAWIGDILQS